MFKEKPNEVSFLLYAQWIVLICGAALGLCFVERSVVGAFVVGGAAYAIPHLLASRWYFHYRGALQTHAMLRALWGGQLLKWIGMALGIWIGMHSSMKATLLGFSLMTATYWVLPWAGGHSV